MVIFTAVTCMLINYYMLLLVLSIVISVSIEVREEHTHAHEYIYVTPHICDGNTHT